MNHVFFLIYRKRRGRKIRWNHPTGGLVMEADHISNGIPVSDIRLAGEVAEMRYHCEADEELVIAEVFQPNGKRRAKALHDNWEYDAHYFRELMNRS